MKQYKFHIRPYDTDICGAVSPVTLVHMGNHSCALKAADEGAGNEFLYEKAGAVWMLARLRLEQIQPIYSRDQVTVSITDRAIDRLYYMRQAVITKDGAQAARLLLSSVAVDREKRRAIRPSEIEKIWPYSKPPISLPPVKKLIPPEKMEKIDQFTVRYADCDFNGHLSSAHYAGIACEYSDYWRDGPRLMSPLQIDYSAECRPGVTVHLHRAEREGILYLRGMSDSGKVYFTLCCKSAGYK